MRILLSLKGRIINNYNMTPYSSLNSESEPLVTASDWKSVNYKSIPNNKEI